jgi:hypothetical protein
MLVTAWVKRPLPKRFRSGSKLPKLPTRAGDAWNRFRKLSVACRGWAAWRGSAPCRPGNWRSSAAPIRTQVAMAEASATSGVWDGHRPCPNPRLRHWGRPVVVCRKKRSRDCTALNPCGGVSVAAVALIRHFAQTDADRQRRITESFSKAVEQLGSDKLEVRLGGIYSLERISKESPDDYWTVMENLTGFVRECSRRNEAERTDLAGPRATGIAPRLFPVAGGWPARRRPKAFGRPPLNRKNSENRQPISPPF